MNTKFRKTFTSILVAALMALALALAYIQPAQAASCTVTSNADSGTGSLRAFLAIKGKNACTAISFNSDMTIALASPLVLSGNVTIDGGTHNVVISGDSNGDGTGETYLFDIPAGISASFQGLTFEKGTGKPIIKGNSVLEGSAIYNAGTVTVANSTFTGNSRSAIFNLDTLEVSGSTFSTNFQGIYNMDQGNSPTATVVNSTFSGSSLSAVRNDGTNATMTVTGSTFSGNHGSYGGGIVNYGRMMTVSNSTFIGNSASGDGGAIDNNGPLMVTNSTIVGNSATMGGGGISSLVHSATIHNTIIANNTSGNGVTCDGLLNNDSSGNLTDDILCLSGSSGSVYSNFIPLGPLGNYGGLTQTVPLLPGSAAIDAGDSAFCPAADQRGIARPQGAGCDVGAFESQGFSLAAASGSDQLAALNTAFAQPLVVSVGSAYGEPVEGGWVTFTAPSAGASTDPAVNKIIISGGEASLSATANGVNGGYAVPASAAGAPSASFFLVNGCTQNRVVTSDLDSGPGSLRQAIDWTCPGGTITFAGDTTIHMASDLNLQRNVTIDGGTHSVVISGDTGNDGSANTLIFDVYTGVVANLNHLTFEKGHGNYGGAILNYYGTVAVTDSTFSGNSATSGGGIYNYHGSLSVTDSTFSNNSAIDGYGGGIRNYLGTLTVTNSTFTGNSALDGGGISNSGTLTVANSTFSGNSASGGGGIRNMGTLTVTDSTFSGNSASNIGGALYNWGGGSAQFINNTFSANSANGVLSQGGALYNYGGSAQFTNNTFVGNSSPSANYGSTYYVAGGSLALYNNIISSSSAYACYSASPSALTGSNNLSENVVGCNSIPTSIRYLPGRIYSTDLHLGPLADNGGPTQTFALLPGSPAIDAGDDSACPATDQRGIDRLGTCDIGAFESQGFSLAITGGDNQTTFPGAAFANPLEVTISSAHGEPVDGGQVTFGAPSTGASAALSASLATITSGTASVTVTANSLPGSYAVSASALGGLNTLQFSLANLQAAASVSLTSSSNPSTSGAEVKFIVTVTGGSGLPAPTGTVTLSIDGSSSAEGTINTLGEVSFAISNLSGGLRTVVAAYSGDATYAGSSSNPLQQTVNQAPVVSQQPVDQTVNEGSQVSFNAAAQAYPAPTVQWWVSTDDGTNWNSIPGATSIPLTFTASSSQNGYQYRANFANSLGRTTSASATLTVQQLPIITQQPADQTVDEGSPASFSAAASSSLALTVQWQVSSDKGGTWTDLPGETSTTLSFTASYSQNSTQYRAVFTNAAGSVTSLAATLTVNMISGTGSISGLVFGDANGNGKQDHGEIGLAGWTVQLMDANGTLLQSVQTDGTGRYNYSFTSLGSHVFRVRLEQPLPAGYLQTTADPADIDLANGQSVNGVNFGTVISADLNVSMQANYDSVAGTIIYTITVINDGPADAAGVILKDVLSKYTSYVSADNPAGTCSKKGSTVTCTLEDLASGSSVTITLTVNRTSTKYAIANTATVTSNVFDIDKADNSIKVTVP